MLELLWLIPLFPLLGVVVLFLFGRKLGDPGSGYVASLAVFGSFVVTVGAFFDLLGRDEHDRHLTNTLFSWVPVGDLNIDMAFIGDQLSITMLLFITGIGFLIHLFAVGYMRDDADFSKFFLYLNLFILSMTLLVLGENLLVTFLGWEGVGICSYMLISYYHEQESAATAGKKALLANRVGDWGVMIAMFLAFEAVGSISYETLNGAAQGGALSEGTATAIVAMLMVGAMGKSAQLPLFIWLPDAMAGPTPVSALIHAATMVTSGVFLMTRINPVLAAAAPEMSTAIAWVGALTAFMAATIAIAQNDIKKVLAYSTVSQLGYMFLAVGSGAFVAAMFHVITHAFFKALMFLGSGSVIAGMHHEQDMRRMGALRKAMPITAVTYMVGWLAISGIPPFSGFWSKDEILLFTLGKHGPVLYAIGIITAVLTAFYMTRQVIMTFFGEARWNQPIVGDAGDDADDHAIADGGHADDHGHAVEPHESPAIMTLPLIVLAGLALVGGVIQLPSFGFIPTGWQHKLESWLHPIVEPGEFHIADAASGVYEAKGLLALLAIACAIVGIAAGLAIYGKRIRRPIEPKFLAKGWGYDGAITAFMGGPGRKMFAAVAWFDTNIIDGAVRGVAKGVGGVATQVRKGQTGNVRNYAAAVGVGVILLLLWFGFGREVLG